MIDGLKPHPAYKDSGVEWLGEVPARRPGEDEALELPGAPVAGVEGEAVREEGHGDGEG